MKTLKNNQIPDKGHTYIKYRIITEACILIYKKIGFTPLQVLNEVRAYLNEEEKTKITFVGRLDPMAEGNIHLLWSGDMEEKKIIQDQDKEYTVEVLLGVKTDTGDILGLIESFQGLDIENDVQKFIGPFVYDYPKYSSPNIKKVLKGENVSNKKQEGYIYNIEEKDVNIFSADNLRKYIFNKFDKCNMEGDFRLEDVKEGWNVFFKNNKNDFKVLTLRVKCKSGTYMRVLSRELGGLALSIIRD